MRFRLRLALTIVAVAAGLVLAFVVFGLAWAHLDIRSVEPPLPTSAALVAAPEASADLPVRVHVINTATQRTSRGGVLEPSLDPDPLAPYTMSVPAFALEWADGRLFLIDLGMDRAEAAAFGAPSELLFDASPMEALGGVAEQLGSRVSRVAGVAFTHLHTDHTHGALALCAAAGREIPLFLGELQATRRNYTTRPGDAHVEAAGCLGRRVLGSDGVLPVPGFDGLSLVPVAGHTPGAQIFVARMGEESPVRTWIFTGDAVNQLEGITRNLPKPTLYSLLVVPENPRRLGEVRLLLAEAAKRPGVGLLVSHDQLQLEASGAPLWPAGRLASP